MIGRIMDFIEDSDPVVLITVAFSVIFFAVVITKAVKEVKKRLRKERAISKLEEKYDSLCQHRNNLIVSGFSNLPNSQHHYYWAKEDGEMNSVEKIKDQLIDVDEDLALLRERFEETKTMFDKKNS